MLKVIIDDITWEVKGNNEKPCAKDIEFNRRKELNEYVRTMFKERYGCTAKIICENRK